MKTRTIEILHRIMTAQYPVKAKHLASEFNVSQRTIRQEVLEANIWLSSKKLPEIRTTEVRFWALKCQIKRLLVSFTFHLQRDSVRGLPK